MSTIYDFEKDLQPEFQPSGEFLDVPTKGMSLQKRIKESTFTIRAGIAGKDIRSLRVADLVFKGLGNYYMRHLAAGRFAKHTIH